MQTWRMYETYCRVVRNERHRKVVRNERHCRVVRNERHCRVVRNELKKTLERKHRSRLNYMICCAT